MPVGVAGLRRRAVARARARGRVAVARAVLLARAGARRGRCRTSCGRRLRRALPIHAGVFVVLNSCSSRSGRRRRAAYFWPEWTLLPLGLLLAAHAWSVAVGGSPRVQALALHAGLAAALGLFLVAVWAVTTRVLLAGWPLLALGLVAGSHAVVVAVEEHPAAGYRRYGRALPVEAGILVLFAAFFTCIWASRSRHFWPLWPILALALVLGVQAVATIATAEERARSRSGSRC